MIYMTVLAQQVRGESQENHENSPGQGRLTTVSWRCWSPLL